MRQPSTPLFVYGTLRDPALLESVLGRDVPPQGFTPATAPGHRAALYPDRLYPGITRSASSVLAGALVQGLTDADFVALDSFEGTEYERRPISVEAGGETIAAEVYWPLAEILESAPGWTFEQWRQDYAVAIVSGGEGPEIMRERLVALRPKLRKLSDNQ